MSWAFIIGQSIYWLACPRIVQWYGSYGEYVNKKGENRVALRDMMLHTHRKRCIDNEWGLNIDEQLALADLLPPHLRERSQTDDGFLAFGAHFSSMLQEGHINPADAFDVLLRIEERSAVCGFCMGGLAFLLGLFLFAYVVVENVIAVCRLL